MVPPHPAAPASTRGERPSALRFCTTTDAPDERALGSGMIEEEQCGPHDRSREKASQRISLRQTPACRPTRQRRGSGPCACSLTNAVVWLPHAYAAERVTRARREEREEPSAWESRRGSEGRGKALSDVPLSPPSPAHLTEPGLRHTPHPLAPRSVLSGFGCAAGGSLPYAASAWRGGQLALGGPDR